MINQLMIINYIQNLTPQNAKKIAERFEIYFDDYEVSICLPYLKNNIARLINYRDPIAIIKRELSPSIEPRTLNKIIALFDKITH